jgi:hypothetical protein
MHDMIWAIAFERVLFMKLAEGSTEATAVKYALEYANRAVMAYGKAVREGLAVRR